MPNRKELQAKITSAKAVQKITKSMERIAISKVKKTQERMRLSRPYASAVRGIVSRIFSSNLRLKEPPLYLNPRPSVKAVGYLVVSSRQGLCGSLNSELFKTVVAHANRYKTQGVDSCFGLFGAKAVQFFSKLEVDIIAQKTGLGHNPMIMEVIGPFHAMWQAYTSGKIDELYIGFNKFVSMMEQRPVLESLLPISGSFHTEKGNASEAGPFEYICDSDAKTLLDRLVLRGLEAIVYQRILENLASEQAARRMAMQTASDNAEEIIKELLRKTNKLRQTGITQELNEIVAGTAAMESF